MSIKINLYIFLFVILFFLTSQFELYALIMLFALLHEFGHLICGIILGFQVKSLNVMPLGFSVEFYTNIAEYNIKIKKSNLLTLKKLLIDLAGPVVNISIIIFSFIDELPNNIIYSNLIILLVNLIPIYPLDGGRILRNILKINLKNIDAYKYTNITSNVFCIIISIVSSITIVYYKNISIFFSIFFIWILIFNENKRYNTYRKIIKKIEKGDTNEK